MAPPGSGTICGLDLTATLLVTLDPNLLSLFNLPAGPYYGAVSAQTGFIYPALSPPNPVGGGTCIDFITIQLTPVPEQNSLLLLAAVVMICAVRTKIRKTISR